MSGKILLIGLGSLGASILAALAQDAVAGEILVGSRDPVRGEAFCNLARLQAAAVDRFPAIEFFRLDLNQPEEVARLVSRLSPDLVLSTATMMPWWLPERLPEEQAVTFRQAGFGVWLPVNLSLMVKLMQALKAADYDGLVLSAPFPDVVNPVLAALDLAPTCGIGNLAEIVPKIRLLAATRLGVPAADVMVTLVAHHALEGYTFRPESEIDLQAQRPPYHLDVNYQGRKVVDDLDSDQLVYSAYPIPPGQDTHGLTASAALKLIRAFLSGHGARVHVPGPAGLPGGYPVVASRDGISLALPDGLTLDAAVALNVASHPFDGIARILPTGAVEFVPESAALMREVLGYDCPRLEPAEIDGRADELISRFSAFAAAYGLEMGSR